MEGVGAAEFAAPGHDVRHGLHCAVELRVVEEDDLSELPGAVLIGPVDP